MKNFSAFISAALLLFASPAFSEDFSIQLVGGQKVTTRSNAPSKSLVMIEIYNSAGRVSSFCSATLIGPQTLITAGHCLKNRSAFRVFFTNYRNGLLSTSPKLTSYAEGVNFKIHDSYNRTGKYEYDIAVATFKGAIPAGFAPISIETNASHNYSNTPLLVYGYGRSKNFKPKGSENPFEYMGQLYSGTLTSDSNYFSYPDRYMLIKGSKTFICSGDSGGPQFAFREGRYLLVGVNSAIFGSRLPNGYISCDGTAQATKVAPFATWIRQMERLLTAR